MSGPGRRPRVVEQGPSDQSFAWEAVRLARALTARWDSLSLEAAVISSVFVLEWVSRVVRAGVLCSPACAHWLP